jgi:hypothetical protein
MDALLVWEVQLDRQGWAIAEACKYFSFRGQW